MIDQEYPVQKARALMVLLLILAFSVASCSPGSLEDFQHEGESRCRALVHDLEKIENYDQLAHGEMCLKKHFERLVDLMIEAREFQLKNFDGDLTETLGNLASAALKEELRRIYLIEGGREVIERSQHEALVRLDAYERHKSACK